MKKSLFSLFYFILILILPVIALTAPLITGGGGGGGTSYTTDIDTFLGSADNSEARANLGVDIGADVMPWLSCVASGYISKWNGSAWVCSNTLDIQALDLSDSSTSIPWPVGTTANIPATCSEGMAYWSSDGELLYVCTDSNTWSTISSTPALDAITNPSAAKTFTLVDSTEYALSFGSSGASNIFSIDTRDSAEGVAISGYLTSSGEITGEILRSPKSSGVAGYLGLYEASGTDTSQLYIMGPSTISSEWAFQLSSTAPTAGQVMAFAAPTGTGGPASSPVSAQTWVNPVTNDGTDIAGGALNFITTGIIAGKIGVISKSSAYTIGTTAARESYGYMTLVTAAATVTLPTLAIGMSGCAYSTGSNAVSVKAGASDKWVLNGTALDNGDKVTSASSSGDYICWIAGAANTWYSIGRSGTWTDGGP